MKGRGYWQVWADLAEALEAERDELAHENANLRDAYLCLVGLVLQQEYLSDTVRDLIETRFPEASAA